MDNPITGKDTWLAAILGWRTNPIVGLSFSIKRLVAFFIGYIFLHLFGGYMYYMKMPTSGMVASAVLSTVMCILLSFYSFWRGGFLAQNAGEIWLTTMRPREIIVGLAFYPTCISVLSIVSLLFPHFLLHHYQIQGLKFSLLENIGGEEYFYFFILLLWLAVVTYGVIVSTLLKFMASNFRTNLVIIPGILGCLALSYLFFMATFMTFTEIPIAGWPLLILSNLACMLVFLIRQFYLSDKRFVGLVHPNIYADHDAWRGETYYRRERKKLGIHPGGIFSPATRLNLIRLSILTIVPLMLIYALFLILCLFTITLSPPPVWWGNTQQHEVTVEIPFLTIVLLSIFSGPLVILFPWIAAGLFLIVLNVYRRRLPTLGLPFGRGMSALLLVGLTLLLLYGIFVFYGILGNFSSTIVPTLTSNEAIYFSLFFMGIFLLYFMVVTTGLLGFGLSIRRQLPWAFLLIAIPCGLQFIFLMNVNLYDPDFHYRANEHVISISILLATVSVLFVLPGGADKFHQSLVKRSDSASNPIFQYINDLDQPEQKA